MKHSELRHQPRHVNPRIQGITSHRLMRLEVLIEVEDIN